jgi:hypothetical protein
MTDVHVFQSLDDRDHATAADIKTQIAKKPAD